MINDFTFIQPGNIEEVLQAFSGEGRIVAIAGGTNMMVNMKRAPLEADCVVDLTRVDELKGISEENDVIRIGAGVTFAELLDWHPGGAVEGLMQPMCEAFAGPLIRNLATVGGNICDASAAADISPVLLALDASVELQSLKNGTRKLALEEFFKGVRVTTRQSDELVTAVTFNKPAKNERWYYYKLGKRKADAISIVSIAMILRMKNDVVEDVRIALGAVAPVALRVREAEKSLQGKQLNEDSIKEAAEKALTETSPIDDFRAQAEYRRQMVVTLVRQGLEDIASG